MSAAISDCPVHSTLFSQILSHIKSDVACVGNSEPDYCLRSDKYDLRGCLDLKYQAPICPHVLVCTPLRSFTLKIAARTTITKIQDQKKRGKNPTIKAPTYKRLRITHENKLGINPSVTLARQWLGDHSVVLCPQYSLVFGDRWGNYTAIALAWPRVRWAVVRQD